MFGTKLNFRAAAFSNKLTHKDIFMSKTLDIAIVGSGMAGLTTACLLAKDGHRVNVFEQNWLPGGCSSSYPRKGYIFESGATTLVGLDPYMPLKHLLDELDLDLNPWPLEVPMRVYLQGGQTITRYQSIEAWIAEAERIFGPQGQRGFWSYCYKIAQLVWEVSLVQRVFPPSSVKDLWFAARHFRPKQLGFASLAFRSMKDLLKQYKLLDHKDFVAFIDEQLLITAQNYHGEVNIPFGATALCYTNFTNYYMPGGLLQLIQPLVDYIQGHGGHVHLRAPVSQIKSEKGTYELETNFRGKIHTYQADKVVSSIPINNTLQLVDDPAFTQKYQKRLMTSAQLNSAFQMGIVAKKSRQIDCLHHQIHLKVPLPYTGSNSIFLSLSHPDDTTRCGPDELVASISTHAPDPAARKIEDKTLLETIIINKLDQLDLIKREEIIFTHASTPGSWAKWTGRQWGFVGGYPQQMRIKPWQMLDARFDQKGMYICGDSTYPGQGIPGACLSGIVAYEKMKLDGLNRPTIR